MSTKFIRPAKEPKKTIYSRRHIKTMLEYDLYFDQNGEVREDCPYIAKIQPKHLKIDYNPPNPTDIGAISNYDGSPLFVDPMSIHDVSQGGIGDCYFLSSLGAMAFTDPGIVKFMMTKLSANKFMARYNGPNNVEDHVFTNADLGTVADRIPPSGAIWVPVYEKTFAFYRTRANTYASLNWGFPPLTQLGYTNLMYYTNGSVSIGTIVAAQLSKKMPCVGLTASVMPAGIPLIASHAYVVIGVSSDGKTFTVYNPWGFDGTGQDANTWDGCVTLTLAQLQAGMPYICVGLAFIMKMTPPDPTPAPTATISINPTSMQQGGSANLSWNTTNTTSVLINNSAEALSGTKSVSPAVNTTYNLAATGPGGTMMALAAITVTPPPAPTATISVTQASVVAGNSIGVWWTSNNGTSATLDGTACDLNGSNTLWPTASHTFLLNVNGNGGAVEAKATINVTQPPPPPVISLFSVTPDPLIVGTGATLGWVVVSESPCTVSIDNGIGDVGLQGSTEVTPTITTTYILTATNAGGSLTASVTSVVNEPDPIPLPPTVSISVSPTDIALNSDGKNNLVTVSWTSNNATNLTLNEQPESLNGSRTFNPTQTTSYIVVATGNGSLAAASREVTITPPAPPTVSVSVNPTSITVGGFTALTWSAENAVSATIDGQTVALSGSRTVTWPSNHTYTMVGTNIGGSTTATATLAVTGGVDNAAYVWATCPASMVHGQKYAVTVSMKNTGTTVWTPTQYRLGSRNPQDNTLWGMQRVGLVKNILPGQTNTFSFVATAPTKKGKYHFQWKMVKEAERWFGVLSKDIVVQVV